MHFYVGVTDTDWFSYLRRQQPEDINFWRPNGTQHFKAIKQGAPFLFKLKAPYNAIGGLGFFSTYAALPLSIAWDAFGIRNGCSSLSELKSMIVKYRSKKNNVSKMPIVIGCIILTNPIFFDDSEFIDIPSDWSQNIVSGKGYDDTDPIGHRLWQEVQIRLQHRRFYTQQSVDHIDNDHLDDRYRQTASKVRVGQGAFRVMVSEAYHRSCAVTGDHTLPVLEAAHIKSYSEQGPNRVSNGLLLRSDLHKLFDSGYMTVTPDYHIEISPLLREEFHNGKIYYALHGKTLVSLPEQQSQMPDRDFLDWHNQYVYQY